MSDLFNPDRRKSRDRRMAPRAAASGNVEISFDQPVPTLIKAELIETSRLGFRALHNSQALEPGLEVSYRGPGMSGRARIIWTHVSSAGRVSGFLVLSNSSHP